MIERTRFDRRAFRTLIEHADIDNPHAAEVALNTRQRALLELSAVHTVAAMADVLDEVVERCGRTAALPTSS